MFFGNSRVEFPKVFPLFVMVSWQVSAGMISKNLSAGPEKTPPKNGGVGEEGNAIETRFMEREACENDEIRLKLRAQELLLIQRHRCCLISVELLRANPAML